MSRERKKYGNGAYLGDGIIRVLFARKNFQPLWSTGKEAQGVVKRPKNNFNTADLTSFDLITEIMRTCINDINNE